MGKASSAKKVACAARAGGTRRPGQRRPIGFPLAVGLICVLGISLIVFARNQRAADAFPRANEDHVHSAVDIFTCVTVGSPESNPTTTTTAPGETTSTSEGETTTTATADTTATPEGETTTTVEGETTTTTAPGDTTTTTAPSDTTTSTTVLVPGDTAGEFQPWPTDASEDKLGIHTHGDGLIHIHPFTNNAAGVNATLGKFLDQTGITMTNDTLRLPSGTEWTEGKTKCVGGKDGELQVGKWNSADEAAKGEKPNQVFTEGFDKVRLGQDQVFLIAFMPAGSTLKSKDDVVTRIKTVTDVAPSEDSTSSDTTPQPDVSVSLPPDSTSSDTGTTAPTASASAEATVTPDSSSSSP